MVKQSYGTSTGGVNRSEKGDLPSDKSLPDTIAVAL